MSGVLPIRPERPACTGQGRRAEPVEEAGLVERVRTVVYRMRRRFLTGIGVLLVLFFAWHVVFGRNGVNNYERKRADDHALQQQIQSLQQQNKLLASHVSHLESDPDEIEFEATKKLHYVRPGEVIYKLNTPPQQNGN